MLMKNTESKNAITAFFKYCLCDLFIGFYKGTD